MRAAGKILRGLTVLLFVCGIGGAAFAEVGVTDDEIKLGSIVDLSGPIAFMGKGVSNGEFTYFKHINDQGGVHGRKISLIVEDDAYSPPKAVAAAKKLIERDRIFCIAMVLGSAQCLAMYPMLERAGIPIIQAATQNSRIAHPPKKYLFLADPSYLDQAKVHLAFALKYLKMQNPKAGMVYQDDEPGHDYRDGVRIACEHYGVDLVIDAPYKRGTVDFSSHIAKLKAAGVDLALTWTLVREPAALLKEAMKVEYAPVWLTCNPSGDPMILKLAGDAAFYGSGYFCSGVVAYPFEDNPEIVEMNTAWPKYNKTPWSFYDYYGWGAGKIMVEGLRRAGRDLTREGLIKAMETFDEYRTGVFGPLTWGPDLRAGNKYCQWVGPVRMPGGNHKWFPISAWMKAEF